MNVSRNRESRAAHGSIRPVLEITALRTVCDNNTAIALAQTTKLMEVEHQKFFKTKPYEVDNSNPF